MTQHATLIQEDRPLTDAESDLIRWLLENSDEEAKTFLTQLPKARVVARCSCGCASVDVAIAGRCGSPKGGLQVLSDFQWYTSEGFLFGVFVFAYEGLIGGLDIWSIDGQATPMSLPPHELLRPLGSQVYIC